MDKANDNLRTGKVAKGVIAKGKAAVQEHSTRLTRLVVEYVTISAIVPNPYNPNRQDPHDFELLKRSITTDGFTQPVIVRRADKMIVDGEHRWRAAEALGFTELPVVFVDMTDEQMRVATLRHNRARGSEDVQLAAEVLRDLQELGALDWAQEGLMLSDEELNRLLDDVPAPEALADEQFSEAWEPEKGGTVATNAGEGEQVQQDAATGHTVVSASSPAGVEQTRAREAALAAAKTDEERAQVKKESNVFRISLVFADAEASIIREALGKKPASGLLELCRQELARRAEAPPVAPPAEG